MSTRYVVEVKADGESKLKSTHDTLAKAGMGLLTAAESEGATDLDIKTFMLVLLMDRLQGYAEPSASMYMGLSTITISTITEKEASS